jgi:predicted HTH transcriptional regulator
LPPGDSPTGPDALIRTEALNGDKIVARRYRNRRIEEFLKELDLTAGRCTGIPTIRAAMAENGSLPPRFSPDEGRTHFLVELPVHPQMPGSRRMTGRMTGRIRNSRKLRPRGGACRSAPVKGAVGSSRLR